MADAPAQTPPSLALSTLDGPHRAAVLLLALGQEYGQSVWEKLNDDEVAVVSKAMSGAGNVKSTDVEDLLVDFVSQMSVSGAVRGNYDSTERLLCRFLPEERVSTIMQEIRGPAGRNMWEKLSNVQHGVLANYLKNEYPQTIAVVASKIAPEHAAKVLSNLPEDLALEVVERILRMEPVQREVLEQIEMTLRSEFISNLAQTRQRDAHELMAEIFNNFDRQTETRFLTSLEEIDREATDRIKGLMFTFEDLTKLDASSAQSLIRQAGKERMALAMKGASDPVREFFFTNMSERAGKMLREDLEVMGPVRLKDVDAAQAEVIVLAKEMAARGEIVIAKTGGGDELIY